MFYLQFPRKFARIGWIVLTMLTMSLYVDSAAFGAVVKVSACDSLGGTDSPSFGYEVISKSGLYVIYSGALVTETNGTTSITSSNIYVIKGRPSAGKTLVWVFGNGYGDAANPAIPGDLSDVELYRSSTKPARNAKVDACYLNYVISNELGVPANLASMRFLAPHYHLDHINQEFLTELAPLGYQMTYSKFYVHVRDSLAITNTCNSKCCGQVGTDGKCNRNTTNYWAAPFKSVWDAGALATLVKLGSESDAICTQISKPVSGQVSGFQSTMGDWVLNLGPTDHTRGPLYLSLSGATDGKNYLIKGADGQNGVVDPCDSVFPATSYVVLGIHGRQVGF